MGKLHIDHSILPKPPISKLVYGFMRPITLTEIARLSVSEKPTLTKRKVSYMRSVLNGETIMLPK